MLSLSQSRPNPNQKVVLLTGAAGAIKTSLRHQLGNDYHFREHENLGFQIFYAISGNTRRYWDISNAQTLLGYEPQDNAENLLTNATFPIN
ncbi:hypothetical protein [Nostoc sp.]